MDYWMIATVVLVYVVIGATIALIAPADPYRRRSDYIEMAVIGVLWPVVPVVLLASGALVIAKAGCDHLIRRKRP